MLKMQGGSFQKKTLFLTLCYQEVEDTSVPEGSLAESLRAAAEAAVSQTGFIYDENTGLYYDHSTGFYYNSVRIIFRTLGIFSLLQKFQQQKLMLAKKQDPSWL